MIKESSTADSGDFKSSYPDNLKKMVSKEKESYILENNASYVTAAYES
jgi:hypothetical protein